MNNWWPYAVERALGLKHGVFADFVSAQIRERGHVDRRADIDFLRELTRGP